ncbi:TonB-dependent receptor [Hyunsoonleella rubra]|uniref:TonB-dependent receptor domain-containing protein n=1 Tax=Hyunsoonleella rubra TaxID=1737062 RepID=A0ABW5TAH1_9FLAO
MNCPKLLCFLTLLCTSIFVSAQEKFTISGTVTDASNGETVFGASVFFEGTTVGAITNEYGFYSITADEGDYKLVVSYVGYSTSVKQVNLNSNQKIDFEIAEASTELDEVVVIAEESDRLNIKSPQMSVTKLKMGTIEKMPVVLGETDIIKSIQLLPGVTSVAEASTGFNVRGGAADQNLVLLDEAIIYNTSHLFGLFSVFNTDAIKDIKLYRGGIPARFGGRVSSVLDVRQKDGNSKRFELNGGLGLISSRLSAEGPLFNQKGSFLVAGRGSYAHLFLEASDLENSAKFYDLNLKTNYNIDGNNKLYLSGYFGRDDFNFGTNFDSGYGNASGNLRWNHVFNDRLFSNLSLIYSKYDYLLDFKSFEFDWISEIENYNIKYDLSYFKNEKLQIDFGLNAILYDFNPGEINPTSDTSPINPLLLDQKRAFENGLYISAEHKISDKLTAAYGLRYSYFIRRGGQPLNEYQNGLAVVYNPTLGIYEEGNILGERVYDKDETIKTYGNLEPRLAVSYQLNDNTSIKAGYSHTAQYIHLLSNTLSVTPLDVWTPSGKFIKPQLSDQYSLGYFKNFKDEAYSLEVEAYYKTVDNRIDYVDGSDLIGQNTIETEILNGELRAYGLEFLLRKNKGDFTGWLAYTISKAEQRTPGGASGGPGINNGNWYYAPHDRTHDVSVTASYKLNDKWTFGANAIYQTGRPVTYPDGQYTYEGLNIANFSDRNSSRLPNYHRIDVSATWVPNRKPDRRWKGEWVFGIYNIYNRKNAASIAFGQNRETGAKEATRTAIFGIVPALSYNFKF